VIAGLWGRLGVYPEFHRRGSLGNGVAPYGCFGVWAMRSPPYGGIEVFVSLP
jgi:hypothetical protein